MNTITWKELCGLLNDHFVCIGNDIFDIDFDENNSFIELSHKNAFYRLTRKNNQNPALVDLTGEIIVQPSDDKEINISLLSLVNPRTALDMKRLCYP